MQQKCNECQVVWSFVVVVNKEFFSSINSSEPPLSPASTVRTHRNSERSYHLESWTTKPGWKQQSCTAPSVFCKRGEGVCRLALARRQMKVFARDQKVSASTRRSCLIQRASTHCVVLLVRKRSEERVDTEPLVHKDCEDSLRLKIYRLNAGSNKTRNRSDRWKDGSRETIPGKPCLYCFESSRTVNRNGPNSSASVGWSWFSGRCVICRFCSFSHSKCSHAAHLPFGCMNPGTAHDTNFQHTTLP